MIADQVKQQLRGYQQPVSARLAYGPIRMDPHTGMLQDAGWFLVVDPNTSPMRVQYTTDLTNPRAVKRALKAALR